MIPQEGENRPKLTFADVPPATIRGVLEMCTGHNILSAEFLIDIGIPESVVEPLVKTHESSRRSPSSMIFARDGGVLGAAIGVYDLELVQQICKDMDITTETPYIGRGWQIRDLKERLDKHFETSVPDTFK